MPTKKNFACSIVALFLGTACDATPRPLTTTRPGVMKVFVTIAPQSYFVKRVGGDRVDVGILVGPGQSHHSYEPTPRQIQELSSARVFFRIGLPIERGLIDKIQSSIGDLRIIDTSQGVRLRDAAEACHEEGHDHSHEGSKDPHIWLDPKLVMLQARNIRDGLCAVAPEHRAEFDANLKAFEADLTALDGKLTQVLAPLKGREFFVFHPAYGYFADAYGLKQVAVEEEGKEPSMKRIDSLINRAKQAGVKLIFVQPQFPTAGAKIIADAIGGAVVPLDPMAVDYLSNMESMAREVSKALGQSREATRG
ncbi:MAG: zinc ABC transporter substrate-binding protein [Planctomycetota bacterium]